MPEDVIGVCSGLRGITLLLGLSSVTDDDDDDDGDRVASSQR